MQIVHFESSDRACHSWCVLYKFSLPPEAGLACTGQNSTHLDSLFTGNFLGHETDIADGSLRAIEFRTYNNVVGDYYVAPRFMEHVAVSS